MKFRILLAFVLTAPWAAAGAHDYMGMEPLIVDAKEIEGITNEDGETIKILLRTEDTAAPYAAGLCRCAHRSESTAAANRGGGAVRFRGEPVAFDLKVHPQRPASRPSFCRPHRR